MYDNDIVGVFKKENEREPMAPRYMHRSIINEKL